MSKKIIAFDLDDTLAPSKSHFDPQMVALFDRLLAVYDVCVISGARFELFQRQFLSQITTEPDSLARLHLMPTSGTRYYRYIDGQWAMQYAEDFTPDEKKKIITALEEGLQESGYTEDVTYGDIIEDRDSQITMSALGQDIVAKLGDEGVKIKKAWDPNRTKKSKIRDLVQPKIPEFSVNAAGATSIDVTRPGVNKAYGVNRLMELTGTKKSEILFMGDSIVPGGNDYPVEEMGVDCIAVRNWRDTAYAIEGILGVSE